MFTTSFKNRFALIVLFVPVLCFAESHCQKNETVLLNGAVGKFDAKGNLQMNGKVISLCVDRNKAPFTKVVYRFGGIGSIEIEETFSKKRKLDLDIEAEGYGGGKYSHNYVFYFTKGNIKYQISKSVGHMQNNQGKLTVYKSDKIIADFGFEIVNFENDANLYIIDPDNGTLFK